jgi:hypothetical protein
MDVQQYQRFSFRVRNKIKACIARVHTFLRAPLKFRSADIHLLFQSEAQIAAQNSLVRLDPTSTRGKRVLIIIPFRDKWEMTKRCIQSLARQNLGQNTLLVALVDNGSVEAETMYGIEQLLRSASPQLAYRHLRYDMPFNYSALNNWAVRDCTDFQPDILFMCNNDIEFLNEDSTLHLLGFLSNQSNAGAVGCTLIYPNRRIQHLFVFIGSKIVGSHPHKGRPLNLKDAWYQVPRPVSGVTGAVTLYDAGAFRDAGGFDENLPTSYQDVDLCLKMQALGRVNWVVPYVVAIHHEGQTRGRSPSWGEAAYMYQKWGKKVTQNAFVHPRLIRSSEHYALRPGS